MKGAVALNEAGRPYLCLGFRTWGAIGVEMQEHKVDGKAGVLNMRQAASVTEDGDDSLF